MAKYLCRNSKKCHSYYRLVPFEGLRQCLSFSVIDLVLWHYNSSNNHQLIVNHTTFALLHGVLQKSFIITFALHFISMMITIAVPFILLWFVSTLYNDGCCGDEGVAHSSDHGHCQCGTELEIASDGGHANDVIDIEIDIDVMMDGDCPWHKVQCVLSEWRLESVLTILYGALISGIAVLLPYILKFKYLIAHIYLGENVEHSLDVDTVQHMMNGVNSYYQQIIEFLERDKLLNVCFGRDVASIIIQFLPSLHSSFFVE